MIALVCKWVSFLLSIGSLQGYLIRDERFFGFQRNGLRANKIDMRILEIPPVMKLESVEQFIYQQIPQKSVIRWYIAKVQDKKAYAEVVYLKNDSLIDDSS